MDVSEEQLIGRVRELVRGDFSARVAVADHDGVFSRENMDALRQLGIPGMALPAAYGGSAIGIEAHLRVMEEIAYADPSTAVALNMHLLVADLLAMVPMWSHGAKVLADVATTGATICAPGSIPTGELDSRRSGFAVTERGQDLVVNGKAGFASGSDGASYVLLAGSIAREGQEPDLALCLPPRDTPGLSILGNWDAMGLRATASHDAVCEDVLILMSEAAVIPAPILRALLLAGQAQGGISQQRSRGALGILAIWLGASQAALDFTVDYVGQRHGYLAGNGPPGLGTPPGYRADEAWAQLGIGVMDHWIGTGRVVLYDMARSLSQPFADAQDFARAMTRTVYHLRRMSEEVAQGAMKVCGAHAYVRTRPLERIVRDLIGGNVMAWKTDQLAMMLGQGALGMPITIAGPAGA